MIIQAAMMCLNEEDFILAWLHNVRRFVDSAVILDGGSKDRTIEIIKKFKEETGFPIRLEIVPQEGEDYNYPLYNHAARRNLLYSFVDPKADWIFNLDVDEHLIATDGILRDLVKKYPERICFTFRRITFWFHPAYYRPEWSHGRVPWMWKNNAGILYGKENPPHELPQYQGRNLGELALGTQRIEVPEAVAEIHHYHYCFGRKARRDFKIDDHQTFVERRAWVVEYHDNCEPWPGRFSPEYEKYCEEIKI